MALTLADAETWARTALRDENQDSYGQTDVRNAIRFVVRRFCKLTGWLRTTGSLSLSASDATFDG